MSFMTKRYYQLLSQHGLYHKLQSPAQLRLFLEHHVVCAWSYSAILKSLQKDLVAIAQPFGSDAMKEAIRLVSQLMLEEEVNEVEAGRFMSHLELYVEAMHDLGCDVVPTLSFFDGLESGIPVARALRYAIFPQLADQYAKAILELAEAPLIERVVTLFYEGEPYLPMNFVHQLERWNGDRSLDRLIEYFYLHLEGIKNPKFSAASRLVEIVCGDSDLMHTAADKAASRILGLRAAMWDGILDAIEGVSDTPFCAAATRHLHLVT